MRTFRLSWVSLCFFSILITYGRTTGATQVSCATAVVDQRGFLLGWTLQQPTQDHPTQSPHFPTRMHVAFSKNGTLFVSDDRNTVALDPNLPHHVTHRSADQTSFLHAESEESLLVPGSVPLQILQVALHKADRTDGVIPFLSTTKTFTVDPLKDRKQTNILGYSSSPLPRISYLAVSEEEDKYWVVVMRQEGERFVFEYDLELPQKPESGAPLFVGTTKDLSSIIVGEVTQEEVRLTLKRGEELLPTVKIPHKTGSPLTGKGGYRTLIASHSGTSLLVGSLLVTHAFEANHSPEILALSENPVAGRVAAFSADGRWLAYHEHQESTPLARRPLALVNVFTGKTAQEIHLDGIIRTSQLEFSPDGEHLALVGYSHYPRNINNRSVLQLFKMENLLASQTRDPLRGDPDA